MMMMLMMMTIMMMMMTRMMMTMMMRMLKMMMTVMMMMMMMMMMTMMMMMMMMMMMLMVVVVMMLTIVIMMTRMTMMIMTRRGRLLAMASCAGEAKFGGRLGADRRHALMQFDCNTLRMVSENLVRTVVQWHRVSFSNFVLGGPTKMVQAPKQGSPFFSPGSLNN